jgi:hypothetical protein
MARVCMDVCAHALAASGDANAQSGAANVRSNAQMPTRNQRSCLFLKIRVRVCARACVRACVCDGGEGGAEGKDTLTLSTT